MYLGIDLGTSSVKCALIDEAQSLIATSTAPLMLSHPQALWSEQNPEDWWLAVQTAVDILKKNHRSSLSSLRAIGLSGQMHGATLLDCKGNVLRPAILWNDGRSFKACEVLKEREPDAETITGNLIFPGFTAPKLLWVKEHEPEIFKATQMVLLPKDYLRFCLTGVYATDLSDASGTSWLDVGKRIWSDRMLAATELTITNMPTLFEGPEITGTVTQEIAASWGIPTNTVVVAGAGDNAASAISMNTINPGEAFLSLGTSGVYFVADDHYRPNPTAAIHTMCHALPHRWHEMNVYLSAGSAVTWYAKQIAKSPLATLLKAAEAQHSLNAPLFLPHLSGERTPYNNPHAQAVFFGMTHKTQQSTLMQSVLEGVALLIAQGQQTLESMGIQPTEINVVGGGAESKYWGKILASALNRQLTYREDSDCGAAMGAAKLAWLGISGGDPSTVLKAPPISHYIEPESTWVDHYAKQLERVKKIYSAVEPYF